MLLGSQPIIEYLSWTWRQQCDGILCLTYPLEECRSRGASPSTCTLRPTPPGVVHLHVSNMVCVLRWGTSRAYASAGGERLNGSTTASSPANVPAIVVLEDDVDISRLIQYQLENAGYAVKAYPAVGNLMRDAESSRPQLFLLDVMVPGGDGMDLCRRLRSHPTLASVPIIFVTARASENDRVAGLELGADDYISKPFSPRELVARVKAVLRRFEPVPAPAGEAAVLQIESLEIDSGAMQLKVGGVLVPTTATEFRLLDYLARHPARVFYPRPFAGMPVWGDARFVTPRQRRRVRAAHSREDRSRPGEPAVS